MKYDVFISYSRHDLKEVKEIKAEIEQSTKACCWMDLDGIESGEQFEKVIISAINRSQIFLFMLSERSMNSEWTLDELDFAKKKGKKLVIVSIEDVRMSDIFYFRYHKYDQIKWNNRPEREKLIRDIKKWVESTPNTSKAYTEGVLVHDKIENSSFPSSGSNIISGKYDKIRNNTFAIIASAMKHGWRWIVGIFCVLIVILFI